MLKEYLCRAAFSLALVSAVCVSCSAFAQDDASTASGKTPVSTRSIRPFIRSETPANQAPDLYDKSSGEFNYFREDLGRQETSTRQKARLEQLASRVVYADPMDKPAADGTPFVDIYSLDEVYEDGKSFVGFDDPDVIYAPDEENPLVAFADFCDGVNLGISLVAALTGISDVADSSNMYGSGGSPMPMGPAMPMPNPTYMDPSVAPGGMSGDPSMTGSQGASAQEPPKKEVKPSESDDTALIFPDADDDNPFEGSVDPVEGALDFFQADRDFVVKETAPQNAMMMMGSGGISMSPGSGGISMSPGSGDPSSAPGDK